MATVDRNIEKSRTDSTQADEMAALAADGMLGPNPFVGLRPRDILATVQQIGAQMFIDTGAFGPGGKLTIVEAHTTNRWSVTVDIARSVGAAALALP